MYAETSGGEYGCSALLLPPLAETLTVREPGIPLEGEDTTQQQVAMTVHSYRDRHSEVRKTSSLFMSEGSAPPHNGEEIVSDRLHPGVGYEHVKYSLRVPRGRRET